MDENNNEITTRERQILEWIQQDPMISQNDLADLAGISRSGVAVHISNLMKKGYLRGKGYIFPPQNHVTVIGGVNMDTYGVGVEPFTAKTSNSGHIYHSIGGLGRNISLNLRKLGIFNYFISVYGDDADGEQFKVDATNHDMDITYSKQLMNEKTSSYIYLNQPDGERFIGLDDMEINDRLTPELLEARSEVIRHSRAVIVDTNLPEDTIQWVVTHFDGPVLAKAVSLAKVGRLQSSLSSLNTLVINGIEAPVLVETVPGDKESALRCAQELVDTGVENVFLYVDNIGTVYANRQQHIFLPQPDIHQKNTNGAGGAAIAALVLAAVNGLDFKQTAQLAAAAAYITSESPDSVNEAMSTDLIQKKIESLF
ncbi:PfkB family carbohydrate kinase [Secundilactobacillus oryzae]|uniref:PfkB family carbohydrate kinase n=1 Tax=Secundilactobacillus oryzae TaxID=1202668 RepID=UPI001F320AE9|nr:PfkB family carbohydrate kinase [Secundilactobacillus oryzae]